MSYPLFIIKPPKFIGENPYLLTPRYFEEYSKSDFSWVTLNPWINSFRLMGLMYGFRWLYFEDVFRRWKEKVSEVVKTSTCNKSLFENGKDIAYIVISPHSFDNVNKIQLKHSFMYDIILSSSRFSIVSDGFIVIPTLKKTFETIRNDKHEVKYNTKLPEIHHHDKPAGGLFDGDTICICPIRTGRKQLCLERH